MRKMAEEMGAEQIIALDSKGDFDGGEEYALSADHPQIYGVGSSGEITSYLEKGVLTAVAAWSKYAAGYLAVELRRRRFRGEGPLG